MSDQPTHILVLTARPGSGAIGDDAVAALTSALTPAGPGRWLAPGDAWEQPLRLSASPAPSAALRASVANHLAGRPIDVNVVPAAGRRKALLVADMESTIIEQECIDELADHIGKREHIAAITARAMRGELDFEAALKERVGMLAGLDAGVLDDLYGTRVTLMPGAATLVATMRAHGARCALVSGGFTFFTERIARRLGFDTQQANVLEIADGKLAGTVREPILGREAKLAALQRLAAGYGIAMSDTMATGDGANDLAMIGAAGLGVAFRAKPVVAEAAAAAITHGDLTGLLYLQGYAREEFSAA